MSKTEIQNLVVDYANGYGIDPAVAVAQIQRESGFNPNAVGHDGERGLAQILPNTWPQALPGVSFAAAFDPDYNLTAWGNYMLWLLNRYDWNYSKALMAYNGGPGNLDHGTVSRAARNYAKTIIANAGWQTDMPAIADSPEDESGLSIWAVAGILGAVLAVAFLRGK
ncbi:MAG: transglycosylase SLT domain-containing protein [Patescibacteria group bacterium]|nr:transglycosylase SLT domain-containing protein [Patescibacteria group bacterium]